MRGSSKRFLVAFALSLAVASVASAAAVTSQMGQAMSGVMSEAGFYITPVGSGGQNYGDLAPSQLFEIVRPGNQAISIGRLFTSCSCVRLEADSYSFAPGQPAVLRLRNVIATPPQGQNYAIYVQITSPIRTTLRFDTFVQSSQFVPANVQMGETPTRGNIIADGVLPMDGSYISGSRVEYAQPAATGSYVTTTTSPTQTTYSSTTTYSPAPSTSSSSGAATQYVTSSIPYSGDYKDIEVIVPHADNYVPDTSEYTLRKQAEDKANQLAKDAASGSVPASSAAAKDDPKSIVGATEKKPASNAAESEKRPATISDKLSDRLMNPDAPKKTEEKKPVNQELHNAITGAVAKAEQNLAETQAAASVGAEAGAENAAANLGNATKNLGDATDAVRDEAKKIGQDILNGPSAAERAAARTAAAEKAAAEKALAGAGKAVADSSKTITDKIGKAEDKTVAAAGKVADAVKSGEQKAAGAAEDLWAETKNKAGAAGKAVADTGKNAAEAVKSTASDAVQGASNLAGKAADTAGKAADAVKSTASDAVQGAENLAGKAADTAGKAADAVKSTASGAVQGAENVAGKAADAVKSAASDAKQAASDTWQELKKDL